MEPLWLHLHYRLWGMQWTFENYFTCPFFLVPFLSTSDNGVQPNWEKTRQGDGVQTYTKEGSAHLLVSSSRSFASNSLLGGYFGKFNRSQGRGCVVKNWQKSKQNKKDTHSYAAPSNQDNHPILKTCTLVQFKVIAKKYGCRNRTDKASHPTLIRNGRTSEKITV